MTFSAAQHGLRKQAKLQRDSLTKQPEPPEEEQRTAGAQKRIKPEAKAERDRDKENNGKDRRS